jgi:4-aminobutyrate aminotransferase-like enzyme/Ser/Thr protein kinase RdoA (MazF antagonist)
MTVVDLVPRFAEAEVARFVQSTYGLRGTLRRLPGERDQNWLLDAGGTRYVVKIANALEHPQRIDFQHAALRQLAAHVPSYQFPRVHATIGGATLAPIEDVEGTSYWCSVLSFVPGVSLADVNPHTPALLEEVGRVVGLIDSAFAGFTHPDMRRPMHWDIRYAAHLRTQLGDIAQPERRALVERVLDRFDNGVVPRLDTLRASVIYNDANDYNVLVSAPGTARHVVGMIDMGDLSYGPVVCDLAVAATYAMFGKDDPLAAAASVVRGYHAVFPLREAEVDLLYDLIRTRLALSVCHAATQGRESPDNAYLGVSEAPAWTTLEYLATISPAWACAVFRHACGWDPFAHSAAVVDWLATHPDAIAPVIAADLRHEPLTVFDLGVASVDPLLEHAGDAERFSAAIFGRMRDAGARVGVGRYDEARILYAADQFSSGAERRTIHLGIDLFTEPGSAVYAALQGVVHSFRDNALPLDYGPTFILEHEVDGLRFYTLYGHLDRASLEQCWVGKPVRRGEQIGRVGTLEVNGGWPPHLHVQIIADMLGLAGDFPGVGTAKERPVWRSVSPDPNVLLGIPADRFPVEQEAPEQIMATRADHLGPSLSTAYQHHLTIVRGSMQYLYDHTGRAYLDAVNNVPHVGHSRPEVVRAAQRQMATLNTNTRYLHPLLARYVERLAATMPAPLSVVFLVNSGSEANELALRLVRAATGRRDMLVLDHAYHGHTSALIDLSPYKHDGPGGTGAPDWVHTMTMPDPYRGPHRGYGVESGIAYAHEVARRIDEMTAGGHQIAGFICESLLGCGGQIVLPQGYLPAVYRAVRAAGGVCIADEVQVGFGRVGTHRWGFETQGVVPDIVTLGKPIGNGHPLAAVVTTPDIAGAFANGMEYFNTFGGNPVSCAVGLAVLDVIEADDLQRCAHEVGEHLRAGLRALQARHPIIGDVRGLGLFIGAELVLDHDGLAPADHEASYIAERMKDHGILIGTDGPMHNVLKIKPPLVFTEDNADRLVATLDRVLREDAVRYRVRA